MNDRETRDQRLPVHERLAVLALLAFFLVLCGITWKQPFQSTEHIVESQHYVVEPFVTVHIAGAVNKPGAYRVRKGVELKEILDLAGLEADADIHRLNLQAKVRNGQQIKVPRKEWIIIKVEHADGQLESVRLHKGSTLQDLCVQFGVKDCFEDKQLKKKLREGQTIRFPHKEIKTVPIQP
jgi:protein involved in polysaccharide export with SLBB domain